MSAIFRAADVTDALELALKASSCDKAHVLHKPRLLSDNGPSYIDGELADWLRHTINPLRLKRVACPT